MKTTQGYLHQTVDELTAAMGWVEMGDAQKAVVHIKQAIALLSEAQVRLQKLSDDIATDITPTETE